MEENITILKSLIEDLEREEKLIGYNAEIEIQAIENIIEENNKFRDGEIVTPKLEAKVRKAVFNDLKNYIPKSKIKEKIEELKKAYEIALEENSTKAFILKCQIDILEKLMEDK